MSDFFDRLIERAHGTPLEIRPRALTPFESFDSPDFEEPVLEIPANEQQPTAPERPTAQRYSAGRPSEPNNDPPARIPNGAAGPRLDSFHQPIQPDAAHTSSAAPPLETRPTLSLPEPYEQPAVAASAVEPPHHPERISSRVPAPLVRAEVKVVDVVDSERAPALALPRQRRPELVPLIADWIHDSQAPPRVSESIPAEQPVHITIGRIDSRAVPAPTPGPAPRPVAPAPHLSLEEYVRQRNEGVR
jgi:hypothetical protein